ncbi:20894_t:CDS:2 [Entrophospora sp. SA101]|nr:20894_t:CDS:2 [Entrophospora sp. SA101]
MKSLKDCDDKTANIPKVIRENVINICQAMPQYYKNKTEHGDMFKLYLSHIIQKPIQPVTLKKKSSMTKGICPTTDGVIPFVLNIGEAELAWLLHIEIKNELMSMNDPHFQTYIYVTRHCPHLWVFAFIQLDGEFVFQSLKYLTLVASNQSTEYQSIFCFFGALKQAVNALEEFYKEVLNKSHLTLNYPYPQQYINENHKIVKFNYKAKYVEAKTLFMIKDDLNIEYKKKVFKDIAEAKRLLHKNQLVFGDLRSTNILVTDMESSSPQGMLVDFDWGGKEGEAWYPTLQNTRDIIWPIGVGPDEYLMMEHDNVLYSWLEVEYGSCELKDVLQPEQYGKKCGFPVVDYAGK